MNSIILALMDFAFELSRWNVVTLVFKCLLDLLTARSTKHTLWASLGMLCCTYSLKFYLASLRHVPSLYRYARQLDIDFAHRPIPMLTFLANIVWFWYVHRYIVHPKWKSVLWSYESKFEIFGSRIGGCRIGERMISACVVSTVKHGGGCVMVLCWWH
jgi:hypothetical protein